MDIYGVDFSGAARAGTRLWVTRGAGAPEPLRIQSCMPACELPGGGRARAMAIDALRQAIRGSGASIWGLDMPFVLPREVLVDTTWHGFLRHFTERFPDPDAMRESCHAMAGGRELKRDTERAARVPFSTWNLRLYRQTWHAIAELLRPLVLAGEAVAVPLDTPRERLPHLLEVCPASFLKERGLYVSYKGREAHHLQARRNLVDALRDDDAIGELSPALARRMIDNRGGDAIDSLIGAVIVWHASRAADFPPPAGELDGRIYWGCGSPAT